VIVIALSKKICLLGDYAVGKTSLVRRFVYNLFDDKYLSTIGVKVSRKVVALPHDNEVIELTLLLWDLAGSEEFSDVRASYMRGSSGAIVVCDLTREATLNNMLGYFQDLRQISPAAQVIIAGNKADLIGQPHLAEEQVKSMAARIGAPYYLTSAKTGDCVEEVFRRLGQAVTV
jgi:small GTP-binding protein